MSSNALQKMFSIMICLAAQDGGMEILMKKIISVMLTFILTLSLCFGLSAADTTSVMAASDNWPAGPDVYAKSAVLIEASTGTVLYDKKCHKKMYPASITKIMTALLTIENCSLDEKVTFSENAVNSLHYDDANFGCQVGEEMSVKDCLYTLMLASANEVATALAEHIAGSTEKFADMMNARATEAGTTDTHFANANGLHDPNHYVTAYDMAMITRAAAQYTLFNDIVNTTTYTVGPNNKRKESAPSNQRHKMVWPTSGYYYDGIIGGKTGYTDQAGTTLVTYAKRNGMTLIAVVLHSNGTNVYADTKALLDYGFDNFNLMNVSQKDTRFSEGDTVSLQSPFCDSTDSIYLDRESNIVIPKKTNFSKLTSEVSFEASGDSFATVTYKLGERSVGTATLKYESNTASPKAAASTEAVSGESKENASAASEESSVKNDNSTKAGKQKQKIKLPKFLIPAVIVILVLIAAFTIITLQRRRLNRIRAMKRHRKR